jgi:hypothetical protein
MKSWVWKNGLDASVPFMVGFVAEVAEIVLAEAIMGGKD